jgi:hypothetical protein
MDNEELYRKATQAAIEYKKVFGKYPSKIGIHAERIRSLTRRSIRFAVQPPPPTLKNMLTEDPFQSIASLPPRTATFVECPFEPIAGEDIKQDEIYMPHGMDEKVAISSKDIAIMARHIQKYPTWG